MVLKFFYLWVFMCEIRNLLLILLVDLNFRNWLYLLLFLFKFIRYLVRFFVFGKFDINIVDLLEGRKFWKKFWLLYIRNRKDWIKSSFNVNMIVDLKKNNLNCYLKINFYFDFGRIKYYWYGIKFEWVL